MVIIFILKFSILNSFSSYPSSTLTLEKKKMKEFSVGFLHLTKFYMPASPSKKNHSFWKISDNYLYA